MAFPPYNPKLTELEREAIMEAASASFRAECGAIAARHKRSTADVALVNVANTAVRLRWANDRIADLEARIAALEANPPLSYEGVYEGGKTYRKGAAVTFSGSLWIAQRDTEAMPGPGDAWKLAVRKGRDGKDAKEGAIHA